MECERAVGSLAEHAVQNERVEVDVLRPLPDRRRLVLMVRTAC